MPTCSHSWQRPSPWFADGCLLAGSSHGREQREEEASSKFYRVSLQKAQTPCISSLPSRPSYLSTPHLLVVSHWGLEFQPIYFRGDTNIQSIIAYTEFGPYTDDIERKFPTGFSWFCTSSEQGHQLLFVSDYLFKDVCRVNRLGRQKEQRASLLTVQYKNMSPFRESLQDLLGAHCKTLPKYGVTLLWYRAPEYKASTWASLCYSHGTQGARRTNWTKLMLPAMP